MNESKRCTCGEKLYIQYDFVKGQIGKGKGKQCVNEKCTKYLLLQYSNSYTNIWLVLLFIIAIAASCGSLIIMGKIMDKCVESGKEIHYSYRGRGTIPSCE